MISFTLTGTAKGLLHLNAGIDSGSSDITAITFTSNTNDRVGSIIGSQATTNGTNLFFGTSKTYANGITNTGMVIDYNGDVSIPGKLTVGIIDPIYVIAEERYATYGHSTIGVKEEVLGKININEKINENLYLYKVDFSQQKQGSDLWLFNEITDFGKDWENLIVMLTPQGQADVWYEIETEENLLMIYSDQSITVSYRLVAPRFDNQEHPTYLPDSDYEGLKVR